MKKISIVIPNYNGQKLLEKNLPRVVKACEYWGKDWEIIVSDDASFDDSVLFLKKNFPFVKVVENKENVRFAENCNRGVGAAKGEIIILLNTDVAPEEDFIAPLLANFEDSLVFAVGCKEKDRQRGTTIFSGRGIMEFKRGLVVHKRAANQEEKTTSWVSGGSGAFDRGKWLLLGGMDSLFRPAYEEDRDLSYVAQKRGWKILFEPKSIVNHHHEMTNKSYFSRNTVKIISFKNHFLFVWKNITDFDYLLQHLLWLFYHLTFTNIRSRGLLFLGFLSALKQLPEAIHKRNTVRGFFVKKDKELI